MTAILIIAGALLLVYALAAACLWYGFRTRFSI